MFERKHYILAFILMLITTLFGFRFLLEANHEFLIYVVVILLVSALIIKTYRKVRYPFACLVGLAIWAVLHLAGGGIVISDKILYGQILISISEQYAIFRYDQLVHAWGFGVSTLIIFHLLANLLKKEEMSRFSVAMIVIMAGCGLGALNENIEFLLTVFLPQTGVGGYINTSLDLCFNLLGAVLAYWIQITFGIISEFPQKNEQIADNEINIKK